MSDYLGDHQGYLFLQHEEKGSFYLDCNWTGIPAQLEVLLLLSEGMGVNAVCRAKGVKAETVNRWMLKAAAHVREVTVYLETGTRLTQSEGSPVKLMNFGLLSIKKANLREEDQEREDRGDRLRVCKCIT